MSPLCSLIHDILLDNNLRSTFLIKIKLLKIGAPINWRPVSLGPGPDLGPHPPNPSEVGADIIQSSVAVGGRK
jgi:hypothetical protein